MKAKKLTVPQVAERLGVVQSRVRAMIKQGKFPSAKKVMRDWVISESDLGLPQVKHRKSGRPGKPKQKQK